MATCTARNRPTRAGVLLAVCLAAALAASAAELAASAAEVLAPQSTADYGSGYTAGGGVFYPGGIPDTGLWLGQPNPQVRNDRALVRFSIAPRLLSGRPVESARLRFALAAFGAPEATHEIEVTHLAYTVSTFSVKDMLSAQADLVGVVTVQKDAAADTEYAIDVTQQVNADIRVGNVYSSFRFRDITAETHTRVDLTGTYGVCLNSLFKLDVR